MSVGHMSALCRCLWTLVGSVGAVNCGALSVSYPVSPDLRNPFTFPRMLSSLYLV